MPLYPEETRSVAAVKPSGRWVWSEESHRLQFVSCGAAEEGLHRKRSPNNEDFNELQRRAEWLAEVCAVTCRGRQSTRKSLKSAHLNAYRSSLLQKQGDYVTLDDVKQVAVGLLQDNYLLPIPFCFLDVLKSKELDKTLAALLLYLSCFFEHKSLVNKATSLLLVDIITEQQMMMEAVAKKEMAKKKLAVWYFSLMMNLESEQHLANHKGQMLSDKTEWLLHACLYSFLCYFAWVTFDRKELGDIQEEVGRLLYSDTFNVAAKSAADGDSGTSSGGAQGSPRTAASDPQEARCNGASKHSKTSQRRPAVGAIVNQKSPLMMSLLPSPKERSAHLFLGSRARSPSPLRPARHRRGDTAALTEQLERQLAAVRCGILGRPLTEFSRSTLKHHSDGGDESGRDVNNNGADHPALKVAACPS